MKKIKLLFTIAIMACCATVGFSQSITTTFAGGNGGATGWAVMYDATIGPGDLDITEFDVNNSSGVGTAFTLDFYTTPGGFAGNEANPGAWTLVGTGSGTSAGVGTASNVVLDAPVTVDAATTYGFAIVLNGGAPAYTNGNGGNQAFSNADISLALGSSISGTFGGTVFNPRVWNGTIYYQAAAPPPPPPAPANCETIVTAPAASWADGTIGTGVASAVATTTVVPAGATVTSVEVTVDMSHSWVADIGIELVSPDGTVIELMAPDDCNINSDNISATFTDAGVANPCVTAVATAGPHEGCNGDYTGGASVNGLVLPNVALATLIGETAMGDWTLNIEDDTGGDGGCLENFTVEVCYESIVAGCDITCPADISVPCEGGSDPAVTGMAMTGTDCVLAFTDETIGCSIMRTWTSTATSGQITSCVQAITLIDDQAPVIVCPPNQVLTCFETILTPPHMNAADFIAAGGTISDNCTGLDMIEVFSQDSNNGGDNCPGNGRVVTRTYFVTDVCGNVATCDQTFTYLTSNTGPVITSILPTCFKYCASLANPMEADITYDTDCSYGGTVNITGPTQIGQDNCPGSIYRYTYTVSDDCGRVSAPVTRDFIIGNDGPTIECAPFNLLLECGDPNNQDYIDAHLATATANSACEVDVNITSFPSNFNLITCNSSTVVTFRATDACGRTATCTTTINISDNTAPVITSTYVDGVCNEAVCGSNVNFWFNEWKDKVLEGLTGADACDSNVSFSTSGPNSPAQNCPDGMAETVITFVANDNCGNTSGIDYSFYVVPADEPAPSPAIAGAIATEMTESVESVTVTLGGNSTVTSMQTAADGLFGFNNLNEGENYSVTPHLNDNPLNGVSSFDLVLISKHVLQLQTLDSPYKLIAADINMSGSITTMDMVELRKLILHIEEAFPNNTSWRFVEAAYVFPDANNPFATIFPEEVFINGLSAQEQHDFVGVKIGDVNNSAVANALAGAEDRTVTDNLVFKLNDRQLKAGETYEVPFRLDASKALHGYQFTMDFDQSALDFVDVRSGSLSNMSIGNFGLALLEEGVITTSWTSQEAQSVLRGTEVFYVTFTAKADVLLSEAIGVSSRYTRAEAYNGELDLMDVAFRFDEENSVTNELRLYQNTPNPFTQETVVGFELPEATKGTLEIFDGSGRMLQQIEGNFVKGYNSVTLSNDNLTVGLMHYRLVTPLGTATMKMILQE